MHAHSIVLVVLVLLGINDAQQPPPSPCPTVFRYEWDGGQEGWRGVVTVVPPTLFSQMIVQVRTTLTFYRKNAGDGEIRLADDTKELAAWVFRRERRPVTFHINFPPYRNLPSLSSINVNGKDFCPHIPVPANTVHTIILEYKLSSGWDGPVAKGDEYQTLEEFEASKFKPRPTRRPTTTEAPVTQRQLSPAGSQQCGRAAALEPVLLITHGEETEQGHWPWHVGMYRVVNGDSAYICGATLVSLGTVVSAAHCVTQGIQSVNPSTRMLFFGKYKWDLYGEATVQPRKVSRIIIHPNFSAANYQSDIAILIPDSPVEFTSFVRPICLWESPNIDVRTVEGRLGVVVGWGIDEEGEQKSELQMAKLPIVPKQTCANSNHEFYNSYTSDKSFCVGHGPHSDVNVCVGDSGGGLYLEKKTADGSVAWQLRGIVSVSPRSRGEKISCDPHQYSVFTDAAHFLTFIKQYLQ